MADRRNTYPGRIYILFVLIILSDMWMGNPMLPQWHLIVATKGRLRLNNDQKQLVPDAKMRNEDVDDGIQIAA